MKARVCILAVLSVGVALLLAALCHSYYTRAFSRAIDYNSQPALLLDAATRLTQTELNALRGLVELRPQGRNVTVTEASELKCAALLLGTLEDQSSKGFILDCLRRATHVQKKGFARELLWALYRIDGDAAAPELVNWLRWQYGTVGYRDDSSDQAVALLRALSLKGGPFPYKMRVDEVIAEAERNLIEIVSQPRTDRWHTALTSLGYQVGHGESATELSEATRFLRDVFEERSIAGLGTAWAHGEWDRNGCVFETWRILAQRLDAKGNLRFPDSPVARARGLKVDPAAWEFILKETNRAAERVQIAR